MSTNPEIANSLQAAGIQTNYHDVGSGEPVLLIHGSGPGVSAWANWRLSLPALSSKFRVIAPDMAGFGFSERPAHYQYNMQNWVAQAVGLLDALELERASVVGNSFGGALALALAIRHPERVNKLVLMGSVGVPFKITEGLDRVWGYEPSLSMMKSLLDIFAYNRALVTDELAELRYQASIRPGFQESFSAMFPAPRQRWVDAMSSALADIRALPHHTLIIHGRDDQVIPLQNAYDLLDLIEHSELHVFGQCGHWTQIEHAASFNQLVAEFLGRA
ncbi:alpha/beta hydrolase [uncultured Thiothrix sp.]|uniref:alpha/beta fold hydrolase n=1 Tax=uncultured Thiothrix sp. TaxID=223185 RepID=UPI00262FCEDF|nr:alpha/beta hydrolase [uncultured Thiothrix sp.]